MRTASTTIYSPPKGVFTRPDPEAGLGNEASRQPIFHLQAANASELPDVRRHQGRTKRASVRGDQQVIRPDRAAGGFQLGPDTAVSAIGRHVERQPPHLRQELFDLMQKPWRALLGTP